MTQLIIAISLSVMAAIAWLASIVGLPGNWVVVIMGAGAWWLAEPGTRLAVGSGALAAMLVFALVGEILEFAAGAFGARRLGGSPRSAVLAVVGSILGAIIGLLIGSGVPVIGNVIASLAGSAFGACAGSILGERSLGKSWEHSVQVGGAALWGRLLGTLGKTFCGTMVVAIFLAAIWL